MNIRRIEYDYNNYYPHFLTIINLPNAGLVASIYDWHQNVLGKEYSFIMDNEFNKIKGEKLPLVIYKINERIN